MGQFDWLFSFHKGEFLLPDLVFACFSEALEIRDFQLFISFFLVRILACWRDLCLCPFCGTAFRMLPVGLCFSRAWICKAESGILVLRQWVFLFHLVDYYVCTCGTKNYSPGILCVRTQDHVFFFFFFHWEFLSACSWNCSTGEP